MYSVQMNDAITKTINDSKEILSEESISDIRDKATKMVQNAEGIKDIQKLTLSMGLPATREILYQMVDNSECEKEKALDRINDLHLVKETGCIKIDFLNTITKKADIAYIILDKCPKLHDVGIQLDILKVHVSNEKWIEILRSISMIIYICRAVYSQTVIKNIDLIRYINQLPNSDLCSQFIDLKVDKSNTTLYLNEEWNHRIGIFIHLESDPYTNEDL